MALITGILSHEADAWWPHVAPLLARVDYDSGWSLDDLLDAVKKAKKQLWVIAHEGAISAAAITEITQYPRHRVLNVFYLAGDKGREWGAEFAATVEAYARANDCKYVSCTGRRGWVRALREFGWAETVTQVRKELK